jgi:hypothetical protein
LSAKTRDFVEILKTINCDLSLDIDENNQFFVVYVNKLRKQSENENTIISCEPARWSKFTILSLIINFITFAAK